MLPALFAFVHHLAAFTLVAALRIQLVTLGETLTLNGARRLLHTDRVYGIAAVLILIVGGLRMRFFEKTPAYYAHSGPFLLKITLFVLVGLLSIYPTLQFLSWRKALAQGALPQVDDAKLAKLRRVLQIEFALVVVIILCAALMAKGVGQIL